MSEELFKEPYLPPISPRDIAEVYPPLIEVVPPTAPPPVEVSPINEVELKSTTDTSYIDIIRLSPSIGKIILLKEISIAPLTPDSTTYGRWYLKIDDKTWRELKLASSISIPYDFNVVVRKEVIIAHRTIDSAHEVKTNAMVVGVECTEEDITKVRGFLLKKLKSVR